MTYLEMHFDLNACGRFFFFAPIYCGAAAQSSSKDTAATPASHSGLQRRCVRSRGSTHAQSTTRPASRIDPRPGAVGTGSSSSLSALGLLCVCVLHLFPASLSPLHVRNCGTGGRLAAAAVFYLILKYLPEDEKKEKRHEREKSAGDQ